MWNDSGVTFANQSVVGTETYGVFVDINDTVYVADYTGNRVLVWLTGSTNPTRIISGNLNNSETLFVTRNGNVYVDNGSSSSYRRVDRWALNETTGTRVMNVTRTCTGLFVDINNTLYCAMYTRHRVITASLNFGVSTAVTIAGTGVSGSAPNLLSGPVGIFVDINRDLYVTDSGNQRVQKFVLGQVNGTTVMGNGALVSSPLNFPRSVTLDRDGNLFVADSNNHRIVTLGPNGFRCIIACLGGSGLSSIRLNGPAAIAFDTHGNIFVADTFNNRIQKFRLSSNSCSKSSIEGCLFMRECSKRVFLLNYFGLLVLILCHCPHSYKNLWTRFYSSSFVNIQIDQLSAKEALNPGSGSDAIFSNLDISMNAILTTTIVPPVLMTSIGEGMYSLETTAGITIEPPIASSSISNSQRACSSRSCALTSSLTLMY
jgi:hypothetical protein